MQTFRERISKELSASPEQVWDVISATDGVDHWFSSMISSCEVKEGKRYCMTVDGIPLVEDIIEVNHQTRTFRFGIPSQEMLPASDIIETMKVMDNGAGKALVEWSGEFRASPEDSDAVRAAFRNLWQMGLEEMEQFINQNK